MDEVTIIANVRAPHQCAHARALQRGLTRHGLNAPVVNDEKLARSAVVACWGWRIGARLRALGKRVLVMERGYLGDRFSWTSLGWNGLNGRATFHARDDGGERFRRHFGGLLRPWRSGGEYVLLIQQVAGDASLAGQDLGPWYRATARKAAEAFGLPVRFRMHPEALKRGAGRLPAPAGTTLIAGELAENLARAAVVITWNSNAGVDAAMAGRPVIAFDAGSMAWPVAGHELAPPPTPDREPWGARLAWAQWRLDEIESGEAWELVRQGAGMPAPARQNGVYDVLPGSCASA